MIKKIALFCLLAMISSDMFAQYTEPNNIDSSLIQFTGLVVTADDNGQMMSVPFATVAINGKGRGTYSNFKGFFSLVVEKGDEVTFSAIGFKPAKYLIADSLKSTRLSVVQIITADTILLPEAIVFPWPDRDYFKQEFLAMQVNVELEETARENLAKKRLAEISENTTMDANENADYFLRKEAQSFYYYGQNPPMNIFSPIAWGQFIKAWKDGKFKKNKR